MGEQEREHREALREVNKWAREQRAAVAAFVEEHERRLAELRPQVEAEEDPQKRQLFGLQLAQMEQQNLLERRLLKTDEWITTLSEAVVTLDNRVSALERLG